MLPETRQQIIASFTQEANEGIKDLLHLAGVKVSNYPSLQEVKAKRQEANEKGYNFKLIPLPYGTQVLQMFTFKGEFIAGNYIAYDKETNSIIRTLIQTKEEWVKLIHEIKN